MRETITCTACSTVLGIPKSGMPKDGLSCNWCGYINRVDSETELEANDKRHSTPRVPEQPAPSIPQPVETPSTSNLAAPEPAAVAAPHRWADDEDDNGMPYTIPQEVVTTKACSKCGKKIDLAAIVCVHCGFDEQAGKKVERTFQPIDLSWESGMKRPLRINLFIAFQVMNVLTILFSLATVGSMPVGFVGILFAVGLQAFVLGTYETVRIRRNKKGQTEITLTWRIAFIDRPPEKVNWKEKEGVAFGHYDGTSVGDWIMAIVLLPFFLIPAILWWAYVIRPDRFYAALARDRGYPETYLYRGMSEAQAKEIVQVATDATGLPLVTPI